jgi:nitrite reductase/ring-hydroxylating ferredoxin subunit
MTVPAAICRADELADGGAGIRFEVDRRGERLAAFAIRYQGEARAYLNRCAHRGVELDWEPGVFFDNEGCRLICSTHGALYDPLTGVCVAGPCRGARLEALPIVESAGQVSLLTDDELHFAQRT